MTLRRRFTIGQLMILVAASAVAMAALAAFGPPAAVLAGAGLSTFLAFALPFAIVPRLRERFGADRLCTAALAMAVLALAMEAAFYGGLALLPAPRLGSLARDLLFLALAAGGYLAFLVAIVAIGLETHPPFSPVVTVLGMLVLITTLPCVPIGGMIVFLLGRAAGLNFR